MCTEWGDSSQIVTIGLAAKYDIWGIIIGGGAAHVVSILISTSLGGCLTKYVSEKWLNLFTGLLFVTFAVLEIVAVA